MHIERIDLNLLVVLNAIYTEGGITKACQKLNLTQSAVSHALGRLRNLFGDELFIREGRAMVPTPLARNLIDPLRQSLRSLESALNNTEKFDPATMRRHFNIALRDVLEASLLPPLISRIRKQAPGALVSTVHVSRHDLEEQLSTGALDAAVDILIPVSGQVRYRQVANDRLAVFVRKEHPAAKKLTLSRYLEQDHVLVTSRRGGIGFEDLELNRLGLQRRIVLSCHHYFAACRVVSQTDLVLTMPEWYGRLVNQQFGNRIIPLPLDIPAPDVYLYWHINVDKEPANTWLREQLMGAMRTYLDAPLTGTSLKSRPGAVTR